MGFYEAPSPGDSQPRVTIHVLENVLLRIPRKGKHFALGGDGAKSTDHPAATERRLSCCWARRFSERSPDFSLKLGTYALQRAPMFSYRIFLMEDMFVPKLLLVIQQVSATDLAFCQGFWPDLA
jgi:hypothetical protein